MFLETSILIGLHRAGRHHRDRGLHGDHHLGGVRRAVRGPSSPAPLAGESLGFALGRFFGPRIRVSRLGRSLGEVNWLRAKNYVDRRGGIAVFVSRFLPVLHALIPLTVGMSAMRYRKFLAWTAPACVLWAGAYVSVGWLAAGSYRQLSSQLHYAGYLFAAIIAVFLLLALLAKKLIVRSEARHMDVPKGDM